MRGDGSSVSSVSRWCLGLFSCVRCSSAGEETSQIDWGPRQDAVPVDEGSINRTPCVQIEWKQERGKGGLEEEIEGGLSTRQYAGTKNKCWTWGGGGIIGDVVVWCCVLCVVCVVVMCGGRRVVSGWSRGKSGSAVRTVTGQN